MGVVCWITGFSGSGKTTLAQQLIFDLQDKKPLLLDGDVLREILGNQCYDRESRLGLAHSYAKLAQYLSDQGFVVVVATISMFEEVREWNRNNIKNYYEVYLKVSEDLRKSKDVKGLFARKEVMVGSFYYEEPQKSDFTFENWETSPVQMSLKIMNKIGDKI